MTNNLIFDTDCISSFLWGGEEGLLLNLYPGQMILPKQVYYELSNPSIPHLRLKIKELCESGNFRLTQILLGSKEYEIYHELAISPPKGDTIIGNGEAAAIAFAKSFNAILVNT